jgi:chemotaxis protein CheD
VTASLVLANPPRSPGLIEIAEERVYLHPGQLAVATSPCTMATVLGSCVAVCLHDPVKRIGGLNHFLLPKAPGGGDTSTRYGDTAMRRLLVEMLRRGSKVSNLEATVIGGACVLHAYLGNKASLGLQNVRMALDALEMARVPVLLRDVGGNRGRHVTFHPCAGDVIVRQL